MLSEESQSHKALLFYFDKCVYSGVSCLAIFGVSLTCVDESTQASSFLEQVPVLQCFLQGGIALLLTFYRLCAFLLQICQM